MADATSVGTNTFTWMDLATTDLSGAKSFYSELFNWKIKDQDAGEAGIYAEASVADKTVGGLYELNAEMKKHGVPPHWMSYLRVDDLDAAVKKVAKLGGKVLSEPMKVLEAGRMAVVQDPTGATFSLWEAGKHAGAMLFNQPGSMCWNELMTHDVSKARDFYTGLFGWKAETEDMGGMQYTVFMNGERAAGGMLTITKEMGEVPPNWSVYIAVDDTEAYAMRAEGLGAKLLVAPQDIPKVGKFATIQDPQGAVFTVLKLEQVPDD